MKKNIIFKTAAILLTAFWSHAALSQSVIQYSYDNNGNRTKRKLVVIPPTNNSNRLAKTDTAKTNQTASATLSDQNGKILLTIPGLKLQPTKQTVSMLAGGQALRIQYFGCSFTL